MPATLVKNRIELLFENKKNDILSVYFSAGYPELNDTAGIIRTLEKAEADIVEVGIPFSDPVADGPTIQESNKAALDNGISLKLIFEQLSGIRKEVNIPIILMGYVNPVLQYGLKAFCEKCEEVKSFLNEQALDGSVVDLKSPEGNKEFRKYYSDKAIKSQIKRMEDGTLKLPIVMFLKDDEVVSTAQDIEETKQILT